MITLVYKIKRKFVYICQLLLSTIYNSYLNLSGNQLQKNSYSIIENKSTKENLVDWENNEIELQNNFETLNINNFLRWTVIRNTMFLNNHQICKHEFNFLKQSNNWNSTWRKKLSDPAFGNPLRSFYKINTTCNSIHHAYHIERYFSFLESNSLKNIEYIIEFGGGYGNLCRIFNAIGYEQSYIIYDLPIFSSLQHYYLSNTLSNQNYQCISDINIFSITLSDIPLEKTLFIATWSLSESPIELRKKIIDLLFDCKYFLIAYQNDFSSINNFEYFTKVFQESFPNTNWINEEIFHIPNNYYLFGKPQR